MATKLYTVEVALSLSVEADNITEARGLLRALWIEASEGLPVGATAFQKDHVAAAWLNANTKES